MSVSRQLWSSSDLMVVHSLPMVLDGPMTGEAFLAYVEQVLVPTLAPGDITGDG